MAKATVPAFDDCPTLEFVATRFIDFVSPWLVLDGQNLAERALCEAIGCYNRDRCAGVEAATRSFVRCLAETAVDLSKYRVSVQDSDGLWIVWSYDEPLMQHLSNHKRKSIQIREREDPVPVAAVMIKLLAAVAPMKALQSAGLDFTNLLASGSTA